MRETLPPSRTAPVSRTTGPTRQTVEHISEAGVYVDASIADTENLPTFLHGSVINWQCDITNHISGVAGADGLYLSNHTYDADALDKLSTMAPHMLRLQCLNWYDWRAGVGPATDTVYDRPLRRPAVTATTPESFNLFGVDAFCQLCDYLAAEPIIIAPLWLGTYGNTATLATFQTANMVEYCNSPSPGLAYAEAQGWTSSQWTHTGITGAETAPAGAYLSTEPAPTGYFAWLRHAFGHTLPYGVRYWEIGNEPEFVPPNWTQVGATYANAVVAHAQAMKAKDSTIKVGACFTANPVYDNVALGPYSNARPYIDFIVYHKYIGQKDPSYYALKDIAIWQDSHDYSVGDVVYKDTAGVSAWTAGMYVTGNQVTGSVSAEVYEATSAYTQADDHRPTAGTYWPLYWEPVAYRCLERHTSNTDFRPETGYDWEAMWTRIHENYTAQDYFNLFSINYAENNNNVEAELTAALAYRLPVFVTEYNVRFGVFEGVSNNMGWTKEQNTLKAALALAKYKNLMIRKGVSAAMLYSAACVNYKRTNWSLRAIADYMNISVPITILTPTYYVMKIYADWALGRHIPVSSGNNSYREAIAFLSNDTCCVFVINMHPTQNYTGTVEVAGVEIKGPTGILTLEGTNGMESHNESATVTQVANPYTNTTSANLGNKFIYTFPAASLTVFVIPLSKG